MRHKYLYECFSKYAWRSTLAGLGNLGIAYSNWCWYDEHRHYRPLYVCVITLSVTTFLWSWWMVGRMLWRWHQLDVRESRE